MRPQYSTADAFKRLARRNSAEARGTMLRKSATASVSVTGARTISFTCSTSAVDRDGDTVNQNGWPLENYRRNPVVLWAHQSTDFPIARAWNVRTEGGGLKAAFEFVPADVPIAGPVAEAVFQLYSKGFLAAVSVGFLPLDWAERSDGGYDFLRAELIEISCCPVPANPEALIDNPAAAQQRALDRARLLARYYRLERAYAL